MERRNSAPEMIVILGEKAALDRLIIEASWMMTMIRVSLGIRFATW